VFAVLLWVVPLIAVSVLVSLDPVKRSVTPVFHLAASRWWAREPLYADVRGFHYLPQFALLFSPFHALPRPLGDIVWRAISVGILLLGLRAFVRRARPADESRFFFLASLLALGPCLGALRNGQTNLAFAGLGLFLAAELSAARWGAAAACLAALVAVKPLGLVFVLLAPWGYRRILRPLSIALMALLLAPFLFAAPPYVLAQYHDAGQHFLAMSGVTEYRFADFAAVLRAAGLQPPAAWLTAIRALTAGVFLLLWIRVSRSPEPWKALTLVLLGGVYLMLFNPMTEKNSYAIVAPPIAVAALHCLESDPSAWRGRTLVLALLSIALLPELLWRFNRDFGLWWDPLAIAVVGGILAWAILSRRQAFLFTGSSGEDAPRC
jgi:alpha-1,2-mannosyltransferase